MIGLLALAAGESLVALFAGIATVAGAVKVTLEVVELYRRIREPAEEEEEAP